MKKILKNNKGSISALAISSVLLFSIVLTTVFLQASATRKFQIGSQLLAKNAYEEQLDNLDEIRDEIKPQEPLEVTDETAPYYPGKGFTKKEGTIDTGLVIQDSAGNEYVWVVVPKTLYENTNYNSNGAKKPSSSTDYENIEYCLQQYTSTYREGTDCSDTWAADTDNEGWLTSDEYTELKNNMLKSVYLNGGFYVGRYEAGITESRIGIFGVNSDEKYEKPTAVPVSKADVYPYINITRTQAQNLTEGVNSGNRTSSLMFGVQWDLVLAFMAKDKTKITSTTVLTSNSTPIGNYSDSAFKLNSNSKYLTMSSWSLSTTWNPAATTTENFVDSSLNKISQSSEENGILVTTGTSEQNKVMNIYDIAGNVWEWTLEENSSTSSPCVFRGGFCGSEGSGYPASFRYPDDAFDALDYVGFRVSLW